MVERIATSNGETLEGSNQADLLEAVGFSDNTLLGLAGDDELIAGTDGTLRAGAGDDILDATAGNGGNTLEGEAGNDDLFGGDVIDNPDTLNGGEGDDRLFAGTAGNILTGGTGEDQFWVAQAELPESPSLITDFPVGFDVIGIAGLGAIIQAFEDLEIEQADGNTTISVVDNGQTIPLTILEGFTDDLAQQQITDDFIILASADLPSVSLAIAPTEGSEEEETTFTLTVTASEAVTGDRSVSLTLSGDAEEDDFTTAIPETITIADGETLATVEVTVNDDDIVEGNETAIFTISNPSAGILLGDPLEAQATIIDNNFPSVTLAITPSSGSEDDQTVFTLTVAASEAVTGDQSVNLALTGSAIAADFVEAIPETITIADGETNATVELTVNDDEIVEGDETAIFTISNPSSGIELGDSVEAEATIADNDEAVLPVVTLSIAPTTGSEEDETVFTLTATASEAVVGEQTVSLNLSGDVIPNDFVGTIPDTITIADGATTGTVQVTVNDDEIVEDDETATFTLSDPSDGIQLGSPEQVSATIVDNDEADGRSLVTLAITPSQGTEEDQTVFTLTVTASEAVTGDQTVDFALSGDAIAADFVEAIPDTLTIADGQTSETLQLTVNDDDLVEGDETATFTLSNPTEGIVLADPEQVSATIIDNDDPTPAGDRVFRFFNTETGGHFYTANVAEREFITNQLPEFELEGVGFLAAQAGDPNATDVFRFFNTEEGQHFYTASEEERGFVEENLPNFVFEGVAFSAYEEELPETTPVFRFFDAEGSGHFYTASTEERDFVEQNLPNFELEGVGFFANDISEGLLA